MEEQLLKQNTDCVYFLASPLTCKKGVDCEYRHNEIARLNPRDCWYWLAGSCLNPTCGFRHPPQEGLGTPSEATQSSVPVSKTGVPCYYFFNGFCNKGDRCSFFHGNNGAMVVGKPEKMGSRKTDALISEDNSASLNEKGSKPIEKYYDPSKSVPKSTVDLRSKLKEDLLQKLPEKFLHQSVHIQTSPSGCEEVAPTESDSLLPSEASAHSKSHLSIDQGSEGEQVVDNSEPEERWESSPGFDVLVDDDKSEKLDYEDDPDYLLAIDREHVEHRELNSNFAGYDFEDPDDYESMYHDSELLYERELYNSYDHLENERIFLAERKIVYRSGEEISDSLPTRKRQLMPMELVMDDCDNMDLRDCLRRRRLINDSPITGLSKGRNYLHLTGRIQKRPLRRGMNQRLSGGLLPSEGWRKPIESLRKNVTFSNGPHQRRSLRPKQYMPGKHYRENRVASLQNLFSKVSRKPISRDHRSIDESTTFTGPKTLAEIKEQRRKVEENGDCLRKIGRSRKSVSADFQGPKPLSVIMKDKRNV